MVLHPRSWMLCHRYKPNVSVALFLLLATIEWFSSYGLAFKGQWNVLSCALLYTTIPCWNWDLCKTQHYNTSLLWYFVLKMWIVYHGWCCRVLQIWPMLDHWHFINSWGLHSTKWQILLVIKLHEWNKNIKQTHACFGAKNQG